jgi:hypothetical protein
MAIVREGSSSFKKVPSVALMIPAPIKTTSGRSELLMVGMASFPKEIERVWIWDAKFGDEVSRFAPVQ